MRTTKIGVSPMIKWFFFLFFLIEISCFIIVGKLIGILLTLLLIVVTTCIGFATLKEEGVRGAYQHMQMMQGARQIDPAKMPNALVIFAGIFLIIPGFVTDFVGLVLLVPFMRHAIERNLAKKGFMASPASFGKASNDSGRTRNSIHQGDVIDGEYERKDPEDKNT
jgi:UPF0716 protein FxsA